MEHKQKPIGRKNYGHIPHLPESRMGPGDHKCHEGQARIATAKARDRHDDVIVTEKLDGSNVGVARVEGTIYPLGRAGYLAASSPYRQHRMFADWAWENAKRFFDALDDGERLVGEWLVQAHGTRYRLPHEPFVAFDLMIGADRLPWNELLERTEEGDFIMPHVLHRGSPVGVGPVMNLLDTHGFHGTLDPVEGAVWRVERDKLTDRHSGRRERVVDYLVKYVRPDKVDGKYLDESEPVWNQCRGFPTVLSCLP